MIGLLVFSIFGALTLHWLLSKYAMKLGMIDLPDERKTHHGKVPVVGGVVIFIVGTAAEITPVREIQGTTYRPGEISHTLVSDYDMLVRGKLEL